MRGGRRRRDDPAAQAEDWGRPDTEQYESRGRGGGRGRGRGMERDSRGRGRGRGSGNQVASARHQDSGWPEAKEAMVEPSAPAVAEPRPPQHPVLGILGDYASEDDLSESGSDESSSTTSSDTTSGDDASDDDNLVLKGEKEAVPTTKKVVCKFYARSGRCKYGDKCHFAHIKVGPLQ